MCLNCGCGEPDERHHPSDITMADVESAAKGASMPIQQTIANMKKSLDKVPATTAETATASTPG